MYCVCGAVSCKKRGFLIDNRKKSGKRLDGRFPICYNTRVQERRTPFCSHLPGVPASGQYRNTGQSSPYFCVLSVDEGLSALFNFGPAGNPAVPNRFWRCLNISNKDMQINEQIRDREIRVITDAGEQLGIMSAREALRIAEEKDLDLVKIAPQATPPVCKIMDYGKYRFEQAKREKEARKKSAYRGDQGNPPVIEH